MLLRVYWYLLFSSVNHNTSIRHYSPNNVWILWLIFFLLIILLKSDMKTVHKMVKNLTNENIFSTHKICDIWGYTFNINSPSVHMFQLDLLHVNRVWDVRQYKKYIWGSICKMLDIGCVPPLWIVWIAGILTVHTPPLQLLTTCRQCKQLVSPW